MELQILLAIDNLLLRKILTASLELQGHTVTTRDCALRTLRTLQERSFDLILVDVDLTGADLPTVLASAAELQPGARLVLLCDEEPPAWAQGYPCVKKALGREDVSELMVNYEQPPQQEDVA